MKTKRVTMLKLKEILRLKYEAKLSLRQIALSRSLSLGVISKYLQRADAAGLSWPLPQAMSDSELERLIQPPRATTVSLSAAVPDFAEIARELSHKGVSGSCCGANTPRPIPTITTAIPASRSCSGAGGTSNSSPCASTTGPVRSSSSIIAA
jgi:hypothetical protein